MGDHVTITGGGKAYTGWQSVNIQTGIDSLASQFSVSLSRNASMPASGPRMGDAVRVKIGADLVSTAYVERMQPNYTADTIVQSIEGRSKLADLIDCSAVVQTWRNQAAAYIAANLAFPYGIGVVRDDSAGDVLPRFRVVKGETVQQALMRLGQSRNQLWIETPAGDLALTTPGAAGAATDALVLGINVLSGAPTFDFSQRFSHYTAKTQRLLDADVDVDAETTEQDSQIGRFRPKLIVGERGMTRSGLKDRLRWEAAVRAGNSLAVNYTVGSWRQSDGSLWRPNQTVRVTDRVAGWAGVEFLISNVQYALGNQGHRATITVKPKEAYQRWDPAAHPGVLSDRVRRNNFWPELDREAINAAE